MSKRPRPSAPLRKVGRSGGRPRRPRQVPPPDQRKAPAKIGHPTLCTPEVIARFAEQYALDADVEDAANVCGISVRTIREWWTRGEQGDEPYAVFLAECLRAYSKIAQRMKGTIVNAGLTERQAAEKWLRINRPKWREQQHVEVTGKDGGPVNLKAILERAGSMTDEEIDAMLAGEKPEETP